jgi:2-keto-3-deoxy-L-rhamnonate aldolase RhmA
VSIKRRLTRGDVIVGCLLAFDAPWLVEMLGHAGYDFVTIDLEHEPLDLSAAAGLIRAADGVGLPAIVRMSCNERVLPLITAGARGMQVPDVRNTEHARRIVDTVRPPPLGRRTYYTQGRSVEYGRDVARVTAARELADDLLVIAMIEDIATLDELDDILGVEGIDAFYVGPYDLAQSMGHPPAEAVDQAIAEIVARCKGAGKPVGVGVVVPGEVERVTAKVHLGSQILTVPSAWLMVHAVVEQRRAIQAAMPKQAVDNITSKETRPVD